MARFGYSAGAQPTMKLKIRLLRSIYIFMNLEFIGKSLASNNMCRQESMIIIRND